MSLEPNRFGKYKKQDVIDAGFKIFEHGQTATDVKKELGIELTQQQRLENCVGFVCKKEWRGCAPIFDYGQLLLKKKENLL